MISPHAGYIYSGPIAATLYARLKQANHIKRVVLMGPSHHVAFDGIAGSSAEKFVTPLGEVCVDQEALQEVIRFPHVALLDEPHAYEHSLEVQIPFLQKVLLQIKIVPFVVGMASMENVAEILRHFWGEDETLIVVSSDLSHYLSYEDAKNLDQKTTKAIENLNPKAIEDHQACGVRAIQGLLIVAKENGMHVKTLDLRNSGDTVGSKNRVVGYGAYVFES